MTCSKMKTPLTDWTIFIFSIKLLDDSLNILWSALELVGKISNLYLNRYTHYVHDK